MRRPVHRPSGRRGSGRRTALAGRATCRGCRAATIAPRSSTMISSQSRIVLRRCATIRQVQPRRRRLSSIRCSVTGSSALVASSRIRIARLADQGAGDLQPLALSAAEVAPALVDGGVVAARSAAISSWMRGVARRLRPAPVSGIVRRPTSSGCRGSCLRTGRCPGRRWPANGQHLARDLVARPAVEQDLAAPRLVEAAHQLGDRRLAAARGADQRDALPRPERQAEVGRSAAGRAGCSRRSRRAARARPSRRGPIRTSSVPVDLRIDRVAQHVVETGPARRRSPAAGRRA